MSASPRAKKKTLSESERKRTYASYQIEEIGVKVTASHKEGFHLELIRTQKTKQKRPADSPTATEDFRYHLDGLAVLKGCRFRVHIYDTPKKKYTAEGKVTLIDPSGNKAMQKRGAERRKVMAKCTTTEEERKRIVKQEHCEKLNIYRIFPVRDINDILTIVMTLHDKCTEMYRENLSTIASKLQGHPDSSIHPLTMFELNIKGFVNSRSHSVTLRTQNGWRRDLQKICLELNEYTVDGIPDLAIRSLRGKLGNRPDEKLRLAEAFFEYCREQSAYQGENPFSRFWSHHIPEKSFKGGVVRAPLGRIDLKFEAELNKRIEANCQADPRWLAVLLAKEGRFNVQKISTLRWKDLIFDGQMVVVSDYHPEITGSLKDFSRPILPFGAHILTEVYNELVSYAGEDAVAEMFIVSQASNPSAPVEPSQLTRFIRESVYAVGVPATAVQQATALSRGSEGGAGILLLHKNYDDVLVNVCGIPEDSGVFHFLRGKVPTDTMTQYYRSLTDPFARDKLNRLLRRDNRFYTENESNDAIDPITVIEVPVESSETEESNVFTAQKFTVHPASASHLTGVVGDIYLPAGTSVTFYVPHGLEGDIQFRKVLDGKEVRSKKIPQIEY